MNSNELLDTLKAQTGVPSDYALARDVLKVELNSLRGMRKRGLSDDRVVQIATLLNLDPGPILTAIHAERATDPAVRKAWEKVAKTMRAAAAALLIVLGMGLTAPEPLQAAQHLPRYTLCEVKRRRAPWAALGLILGILGLCSGPVYAQGWTDNDTKVEAAYLVLHAIDWSQTRYIAAHPQELHETNQILGEHPSDAEVNRYFILAGLLHAGIAYALPVNARRGWQSITIVVEAGQIARNYNIGIRFEF